MKMSRSLIVILIVAFLFLVILPSCHNSDIPSARIDSFSEVKTIQVLVDQSYVDDKGNKIIDFSLPVYETCKTVFQNIGFKVVDESKEQYDAVLNIKIKGTSLCDYYHDYDTNTKTLLYTGAELDGSILFTIDDIDSVEKSFSEVKEPPSGTVSKPTKPSDAPFDRLGWQKHLFLLLNNIWGIEVLSKSLNVQGIFLKEQVIEALAEVNDSSSVDILINALEDKSLGLNRIDVLEALGKKEDKSAVPVLIDVLMNGDYPLDRGAAAEALGEIGDGGVLDALDQASKEDEDEDVRKACREAIDKILGEMNNN